MTTQTTRHLVIDARTFRPGCTGVGNTVAGLLRGLDKILPDTPWRVTTLRLQTHESESHQNFWQSLKNLHVQPIAVDYEQHPRGDWWMQVGINRVMRELRGDVLFSPAFVGPWGRRSFKRLLMVHDTIAWDVPGNYPHMFGAYLRLATRKSARAADRVLAVSPPAARRIERLGLAQREKIVCVPNAVDHDIFYAQKLNERLRPPTIVYVASFEPRKNHAMLLDAMRRSPLRELGARLILVHNASENEWRAMKAKTQGLDVQLLRPPNAQAIADCLREATVAAMPSTHEGFGLPALETMACGAPLVASDIPAMRWLTAQGRCAALVAPNDENAWATAIFKAIQRDEETMARLKSAQKRAQKFTWQHSAKKLLEESGRVSSGANTR